MRNACFVSFRHGDQELTKTFIEQLYDGLRNELETQLGRDVGVFLDEKRLAGGYLFNEALAQELCTSTCLVMVYTPTYFDETHPYCAREYQAMARMEAGRLAHLDESGRRLGLIIPIIFRGLKHLPGEIRDKRQYHDFQSFLLSGRKMSRHPTFAAVLQEIGEYIADRHRTIGQIHENNCGEFILPEVDAAWLRSMAPQPEPLPGRGT